MPWCLILLQKHFLTSPLHHINSGLHIIVEAVWKCDFISEVAEHFVPLSCFSSCLQPSLSLCFIFCQHPGETSAMSSLLEWTKQLKHPRHFIFQFVCFIQTGKQLSYSKGKLCGKLKNLKWVSWMRSENRLHIVHLWGYHLRLLIPACFCESCASWLQTQFALIETCINVCGQGSTPTNRCNQPPVC